jgi:glycosyltransferase involved in cell wall biosynthesis
MAGSLGRAISLPGRRRPGWRLIAVRHIYDPIVKTPGDAMPAVSLLTPTRLAASRLGFLAQLHADLCVSAVAWEWVIAVDGEHDRSLPASIATDPRVRTLRLGRRVGAANARNLALGLARGRYITSVDDDDHLPSGSLEQRLHAIAAAGCGWVAGRLADLRDGVLVPWACPVSAGRKAAGDVWRSWSCPCLEFPLGPTTLLIDAGLLRSVGGWHGLPQAEDFGMVLAVTGQAGGVMLDDVVYAYRRHPDQLTAQPDFVELEPLVRHITYERGRLLAGGVLHRTAAEQTATEER